MSSFTRFKDKMGPENLNMGHIKLN